MYFEELSVGQAYDAGTVLVTKEDILGFAGRFDPQPIHVDEEFALAGPYGGLIASGMHTLSIAWAAWVRSAWIGEHSRGGLGLDLVQFFEPVRPEDILDVQVKVAELRITRKGRGLCGLNFDVVKEDGPRVLTFRISLLVEQHVEFQHDEVLELRDKGPLDRP